MTLVHLSVPSLLADLRREQEREPNGQFGPGDGSSNSAAVRDAIGLWQRDPIGSQRIREALDGEIGNPRYSNVTEQAAVIGRELDAAPVISDPLYRGVAFGSNSAEAPYQAGQVVGLGVSSFSTEQKFAQEWGNGGHFPSFDYNQHVTMETQGARGLDLDKRGLDVQNLGEHEVISAGQFKITSVEPGERPPRALDHDVYWKVRMEPVERVAARAHAVRSRWWKVDKPDPRLSGGIPDLSRKGVARHLPLADLRREEERGPDGRWESGGEGKPSSGRPTSSGLLDPRSVQSRADLQAVVDRGRLPADTATHEYFYHSVRDPGQLAGIGRDGIKASSGHGQVFLSNGIGQTRNSTVYTDNGARDGYAVVRVPAGTATVGTDRNQREFNVKGVPASDIVSLNRGVNVGGGVTMWESDLAQAALDNPGHADAADLPAEYQGWFALKRAFNEDEPRGADGRWGDGGGAAAPAGGSISEGLAQLNSSASRFTGEVSTVANRDEAEARLDDVKMMREDADLVKDSRDEVGYRFTEFALQERPRDTTAVFVAQEEGVGVAGALSVHVAEDSSETALGDHTGETTKVAYVDYLGSTHVSEGAGSALVKAAAGWASERNLALVGSPTEDAEAFWRSVGWGEDPTNNGYSLMGWSLEQTREAAR